MSTGNGNRSWRDRLGLQDQDDGLPKLSNEFGGDAPRESRTPPPPPPPANGGAAGARDVAPPADSGSRSGGFVPKPAPPKPEESPASPAAQTFAERLRARREAAERAGHAAGDDLGGGLHLRPADEEVNGKKAAMPPPPAPPRQAEEEKKPEPKLMPPPAPEREKPEASASPPPPPPPPPAPKAPSLDAAPARSAPPPPPPPKTEAEAPAQARPKLPLPPPSSLESKPPEAPTQERSSSSQDRVPAPPPSMRDRSDSDFSSFDRPAGAPDYSGGLGSDAGRYSRDVRDVGRSGSSEPPAPPTFGDYSRANEYQPSYANTADSRSTYGSQYRQDDDLYEDEWYDDDRTDSYGGAHARALDTVDDDYEDTRRRPELGRPTADDYADAYYDDYDEGYEEDRRRGKGPLLLFAGLAGVGIIAAVLIFLYMQNQSSTNTANNTPNRVTAPDQPIKQQPQAQPAPTGVEQTKLFYDRIVGDQEVSGERIQSREERPLDPGNGSVEPQPLQPVTPDQLDSGELPVPLPPPLPGTSGSADPAGNNGSTNVVQTSAPSNQNTVAQAASNETVEPAGLTALPLPGANTLPDGSNVPALKPATEPDTTATASNLPRPRAKPLAVIEAARRAGQRTRVASVAPITAAPTEPLAITPLPGSEPRAPAAVPSQPQQAFPQPLQPVQPVQQAQPSLAAQPRSVSRNLGRDDDLGFQRTRPSAGQQTAALQPAQPTVSAPAQPVAPKGSYVVQLASYKDQTAALAGFQELRARHPSLLGRYQPLISKKNVGNFGTFYRLQVGPVANQQSGSKICASLLAAGEKDCLVKQR